MPTRIEQVHALIRTVEFICIGTASDGEDANNALTTILLNTTVFPIGDLYFSFAIQATRISKNGVSTVGDAIQLIGVTYTCMNMNRGSVRTGKKSFDESVKFDRHVYDSVKDVLQANQDKIKFDVFNDALDISEEFARSIRPYDILLNG